MIFCFCASSLTSIPSLESCRHHTYITSIRLQCCLCKAHRFSQTIKGRDTVSSSAAWKKKSSLFEQSFSPSPWLMSDSYVRVARLDTRLLLIRSSTHNPSSRMSALAFYSLLYHLSRFCNKHRGSQRGCKSAGCNATRDPE